MIRKRIFISFVFCKNDPFSFFCFQITTLSIYILPNHPSSQPFEILQDVLSLMHGCPHFLLSPTTSTAFPLAISQQKSFFVFFPLFSQILFSVTNYIGLFNWVKGPIYFTRFVLYNFNGEVGVGFFALLG